jgi:preprotein translocase subunit SecA
MASMLMSKDELEGLELSQKQFSNSIVRAQKQMEGRNFGIRKHVFDYDSVINKQRQAIYRKRDDILMSDKDETTKADFVQRMI